jgi:hypothetical protein
VLAWKLGSTEGWHVGDRVDPCGESSGDVISYNVSLPDQTGITTGGRRGCCDWIRGGESSLSSAELVGELCAVFTPQASSAG